MKVVVVKDTQLLIPNESHKNFTHSGQMIEADTIVQGKPQQIRGLRKGRPFIYKMFVTDNGLFIHLKNVKPMKTTEVKLGADAQRTPTKINMKNASSKSNKKYIGAIVGGVAGFAWCKYKKHSNKKMVGLIIAGAAIGFGAGYLLEGGASKIKVDPSK